jgi:tetratricopeptide (TPR) repeat protein
MKNVIHEIHRRSLWQVLGIYLAVSWIVLQVVDVVGNNFGLPDWVAPASLILLLIGLPIVVATAFVQEGMGARPVDSVPESPGAATDSSAAEPSLAPPVADGGGGGLFTWRNALLGGGAAFALLGLLTAGYLFSRTSGIGPAATLVAQGVFEDGADVVLADFDSSDPDLAEVVSGALRVDLLQSPTIRLVERSELANALTRMQLDENAGITSEVARDLAAREGYGAVIQGEIGTAGAGYVLTANIIGGDEWTSLAAFRATARGEDDLIDAIESLSRDIRDKAGEPLRSVTNSPPLQRVTTSSLEALRVYTRAERLETVGGDRLGGIELYERALEIDPDFAMAHRKLGVVLGNMGIRRSEQVEHLTRAFELRDRLAPSEAYLAEAYYHSAVTGDRTAAIASYEDVLEVAPQLRPALNNLGLLYMLAARFEEAEDLFTRAIEVAPFQVGYSNLASSRFAQGRHEDGLAALDLGIESLPASTAFYENRRVRHAAQVADYDHAEVLSEAFAEAFRGAPEVGRHAWQRKTLSAIQGKLREAETFIDDFHLAANIIAHPMVAAESRAVLSALRGDSARAVSQLLEAFDGVRESMPPQDRLYALVIPRLLELGATSEARAVHAEWIDVVPEQELGIGGRNTRREMTARFALAEGDADEAVRLFEALERECPGPCRLIASLGLARSYELARESGEAIRMYERFLGDNVTTRWREDQWHRASVLERLGQLYEGEGDRSSAASYYQQFVDLWADADDELQPRVESARARITSLEASE